MTPHLRIANKLYELLLGTLMPMRTWGFYIFNEEFDHEEELKNRLFVVWICGLVDTVEASQRFIPEAIKEAEREGFEDLVYNGHQLIKFCTIPANLLSRLTVMSQVSLIDLRNQWVHAYYSARHRENITFKLVRDGKISVKKFTQEEYQKIVDEFWDLPGILDDKLTGIRKALFSEPHPYWVAYKTFDEKSEDFYKMLREGQRFNIDVPNFDYS